MRRATVYFQNRPAGDLVELDEGRGYRFTYASDYVGDGQPISLTLPLQAEPFESPDLFSFFAGLVPEGWYLSIVAPTIKVDEDDTFGLLLHTCRDCVGAVSLVEANAEASGD